MNVRDVDVRLVSVVVGFALTFWVIYVDSTVNTDGFTYLNAAQLFALGEWQKGYALYPWPLYSLTIAGVHFVTHLSLENSAYFLNYLFFSLSVYFFLSIVKAFSDDRAVLVIAAIVILVHPEFNEARADVYRDCGYWAFFLGAIYYFIQFYLSGKLSSALSWSIMIIIALLFRVEGIVVAMLLPVTLFLRDETHLKVKFRLVAMSYSVFVGLGLLAVLWSLVDAGFSEHSFGRLLEPLSRGSALINGSTLEVRTNMLEKHVVGDMGSDYLYILMAAILASICLVKISSAMGIALLALTVNAICTKNPVLQGKLRYVFWGLIVIYSMIILAFLAGNFFLQVRYVIPLSLILAMIIPFSIVKIYRVWDESAGKQRQGIFYFLCLIALYMFGDILIKSGADKSYLKDAGLWVNANIHAPKRILYSDKIIKHYAGEMSPSNYSFNGVKGVLDRPNHGGFDYVVLRVRRKIAGNRSNALLKRLEQYEIKRFGNEVGDIAVVYDLTSEK